MAESEFTSARALLPKLLAKLARESGRAPGLAVVWEEAAGSLMARQARPLRVVDGALVVRTVDGGWKKRIEEHAREIGERLSAATDGEISKVSVEGPQK